MKDLCGYGASSETDKDWYQSGKACEIRDGEYFSIILPFQTINQIHSSIRF